MNTSPPPREPLAEDFGLTRNAIENLHSISKLIRGIFSAIAAIAIVIVMYAERGKTNYLVVIWVGYLFSLMLYAVSGHLIDHVFGVSTPYSLFWHSDFRKYKKYLAAQVEYGVAKVEWLKSQLSWWQGLTGKEFEQAVAELLGKRGYAVFARGKSGDGGIDLIVQKGSEKILVQCKAHKNPIGPHIVRDLYGALTHNNAREAWVVSVSRFTKGAWAFARRKPIRLIMVADLLTEKNFSS